MHDAGGARTGSYILSQLTIGISIVSLVVYIVSLASILSCEEDSL